MVHPEIEKVLQEISSHYGPGYEADVRDKPEVCLLAILKAIKNELSEVSATLNITVQMGFFDNYIEEAQRLLSQTKSKSGLKAEKKPIKTR